MVGPNLPSDRCKLRILSICCGQWQLSNQQLNLSKNIPHHWVTPLIFCLNGTCQLSLRLMYDGEGVWTVVAKSAKLLGRVPRSCLQSKPFDQISELLVGFPEPSSNNRDVRDGMWSPIESSLCCLKWAYNIHIPIANDIVIKPWRKLFKLPTVGSNNFIGAPIIWSYFGIVVIVILLAWAGYVCLNLKPRLCHYR